MSLMSRLFGGGSKRKSGVEPIDHNGFRIYPEPQNDNGTYRLAARIEKEIDGRLLKHQLIRADTFNAADAAVEAAITKAKMLIDDLGDALFD